MNMHHELTLDFTTNSLPVDILIVDDFPENIRFLSAILDKHGYQTRKATSGIAALKAIETTIPSLILLDIRMPGMSGYQVCEQLKTNPQTAHVPIIFLSAADDITDKVEAFKVGGNDYITKPFHVEEVLVRVQNQLNIVMANETIRQLNNQLEQRVKDRTHQLELANAQLSDMAFSDLLTRLPNRAFLTQRLQLLLEQKQRRPEYQFGLFYLDCDRFKDVNDTLGHQAGDELLIAITQRIKSTLPPDDILIRFGGDEFVILLDNLVDSNQAIQQAHNILNHFLTPFRLRERNIFVSFSIGIVLEGTSYNSAEELMRDADIAMYQAKSAGKSRYQVFEPAMYQAIHQRLQIEADMREAIQREELVLHYQPIVDLASSQIVGVEALLRWQHPTQGFISPEQFIPIAEETGLIVQLGLWVFRTATEQLHRWQTQGIVSPSFFMSINVSACQFSQPDFIENVDQILVTTQIDPRCLKLEITETVIMQNFASMAEVIHQLHERLIQVSIDDFGTGYSSLSYLHSFPIDTLKVDRSFIQRLNEGKSSFGLVAAIVQIAHTLNMSLVAEGIETSEQLFELKQLGCQLGQGYLFSKPLAAIEIVDFFSRTQHTFQFESLT